MQLGSHRSLQATSRKAGGTYCRLHHRQPFTPHSAVTRKPSPVCAALQLRDVIEKLISREDLPVDVAEESFQMMLDDFVPEQVSAFLVLLRAKVGDLGTICDTPSLLQLSLVCDRNARSKSIVLLATVG
jgi:hypothetical protein